MKNSTGWPSDRLISQSVAIDPTAIIAPGCIIYGEKIQICAGARLDVGCIVGDGVTISRNTWIRAGSVVLQSIPPNAIAEGNPAQVIGYQNVAGTNTKPEARLIDINHLASSPRPSKIPLDVGGSELYLMRSVTDSRGSLTVGEVPSEIPFMPSRFFTVYGVPSIELRGEHAHRTCEQFLLCPHGSCRVMVDDGASRCEVILDKPDVGIFMPPMIWGTQYRYSSDAVLLVFASHPYDSSDYIRTYEEFLAELN